MKNLEQKILQRIGELVASVCQRITMDFKKEIEELVGAIQLAKLQTPTTILEQSR